MKTSGFTPNHFKFILLGTLLASFIPGTALGESFNAKIKGAVSSYNRQEYENAAKLFQDAQTDRPGDPRLAYNLGNSAYKLGKFDQAVHAYSQALADDSPLKQNSLYNTGNALFRLGKLEEAVSAYKEALKLDPNDMDSKFNLEFAREQLKKRQPQKDEKGKGEQDKQDKDSRKDRSGSDQDKQDAKDEGKDNPSGDKEDRKDASGKNERNKNKPDRGLAGNDSQRPSQPTKKDSMTKEEAEQWLRSLAEDPKKLAQAQIQQDPSNKETPGNDW
ncbi:MAG: tetratricopeptide repeat protein [Nitrospinae bacterium]|nr:tetratricopeptide repeat protein [Nitrospinota bacterium]